MATWFYYVYNSTFCLPFIFGKKREVMCFLVPVKYVLAFDL